MKERIVVAGALAQRPGVAGHAWMFLNYLLGFRKLGFDVLFVDWLSEEIAHGPVASSVGARFLDDTMTRFDLKDAYALLDAGTGQAASGLSRKEVKRRVRDSLLLLNVMGYLDDPDLLAAAPRRVVLDIDPGFGQMWRELGLHDLFAGHDAVATVGANIGRDRCTVPTCGLRWVTTRPPVVLDEWQPSGLRGSRFTSVATWRGAFAPVAYGGRSYGLRVHEFRRFVDLPRLTDIPFELVLDIDSADEADRVRLDEAGWQLQPPATVADVDRYRDFVRGSRAEFMVAKNMYVATESGWFSDRTVCYLASGRPALVQDTGLGDEYATGEGLMTFSSPEEAVDHAREIERDYPRHATAARRVAEEYFASDLVLTRLVEAVA